MQRCGCGLLPRVGAHGGTPKPDEARALLRAIWCHVLRLSAEEAAALQDDAPFAAYGGDSLLAVQALPPYSLWRYALHVRILRHRSRLLRGAGRQSGDIGEI